MAEDAIVVADPSAREVFPIRARDVAAVAAFWSLLALLSAVSRELDPRIPDIPGRVQSAVVTVSYVEYGLWAALTLPIWWLATRYTIERGRRWGRVILFVLLGIAISVALNALLVDVREALLTPLGRFRRRPPPPLPGLGVLDDLIVYFAVLATGVARDYLLRYRSRLHETARLQAMLARAQLDALRSQINPHFLFNTLNAVSALVERDPRGTRRMIARLSDLLRYTLEESTAHEVPLDQELEMLAEYVELMQIRFQGKLDVAFHVDDAARRALVPNLLLQPLVENAFRHGVERLRDGGRIEVRATRRDGDVVIEIADNGPGPGSAGANGIGLSNTQARLQALYGPGGRLTLEPGPSGGAVARVVLPFRTEAIVAPDAIA